MPMFKPSTNSAMAMVGSVLSSLAISVAGASASAPSIAIAALPSSVHHLHQQLVHQKLHDILPPRRKLLSNRRHRHAQGDQNSQSQSNTNFDDLGDDEDECPYTPFLWKITDDATGKHVGFALGTMHLPVDLVTNPEAYESIKAAIEDSCDVYGELNLHSPNVTSELTQCGTTIEETSATIADIPSPELRSKIEAKLLEVATLMEPDDADVAQLLASRMATLPLAEVQRIILYANTPEYTEGYLDSIYADSASGAGLLMDTHLMGLGRPADDLEEVSTQCDIVTALHITSEEVNQAFDSELSAQFSATIEASLTENLSKEMQLYRCGNIDAFQTAISNGMPMDEVTNDFLLNDRNKQMAQKISNILKSEDTDERKMFTVGLAHWIVGDESLIQLLEGYGYSLEHIPKWDGEDAWNHSNQHCGVILHPETGLFVQVEDNHPAISPLKEGVTDMPTHTVVDPMYFTNTSSPTENLDKDLVMMSKSPSMAPVEEGGGGSQPSSGTMLGASSFVALLGTATLYLW